METTVIRGNKVLAQECKACGEDAAGAVYWTWARGSKLEEPEPYCAPCASNLGRSTMWPALYQQAAEVTARLSTEDKLELAAALTEAALAELRAENEARRG